MEIFKYVRTWFEQTLDDATTKHNANFGRKYGKNVKWEMII